MTILVDFNQVVISNIMVQIGNYNVEFEEGIIRHMVLNSLRSYRNKFKNQYGELVICCDDREYWRNSIFPYYKASRKKTREKSDMDWKELFRILNLVRDELKENFPYKVIHVEHAEADDIIGVVCEYNFDEEPILILSGDKDYIQLHKYDNVSQYDPVRKRWINDTNPEKYLAEHIIKGDIGDGIPNILSDGDTFVMGKRQKTMTKKRLANLNVESDELKENYERNQNLIDLEKVPIFIKEQVIDKYKNADPIGREKLFSYFVNNKLKHLMQNIGEF
tara:strand:+ start:6955 stop:7785 length:831 start_codon:yes stop_codon:yes gene_type:complete